MLPVTKLRDPCVLDTEQAGAALSCSAFLVSLQKKGAEQSTPENTESA